METVVLLSRKADTYIDLTINTSDVDLTVSESKATYQQIKDYILKEYNEKVPSLYIAQVKQKYGIIERENYNKAKNENSRQPNCPKDKEKLIEEALKHFKMI